MTEDYKTSIDLELDTECYTCLFTRQKEKSSLTKLAPVCFKKNYQSVVQCSELVKIVTCPVVGLASIFVCPHEKWTANTSLVITILATLYGECSFL